MASALYGVSIRFLKPSTAFRVGLFLFGVGLTGVTLSNSAVFLGCWMFLLGFGNGMTAPYLHNLVLEKADSRVRGTASGFVSPAHYGAEFINPPIFQVLSWFGDTARSFVILSVGAIVGAILIRPDRWSTSSVSANNPKKINI